MAMNRVFRFGPLALPNAAANLLNPAGLTGGVNSGAGNTYIILKHIRIVNKTGAAHTFSLYLGATGGSAAGTEIIGNAKSIPANDAYDWYGLLRLDAADFLTGLADAAASLTIEGEGEIGVA